MSRDLASDFRLWDNSVNVGSLVIRIFFVFFPVHFICPPLPPQPQVDQMAFPGTCPALRISSHPHPRAPNLRGMEGEGWGIVGDLAES